MSFLHVKTSYVRPHAKASFIQPLYNLNKDDGPLKESGYSIGNHVESPVKEPGSLCNGDLKNLDDSKENCLQSLNSADTKLFSELDKIQTWSISVESEYKQKVKRIEEMTQTVQSQRKAIVDLQMQNEKLSLQIFEEDQQRCAILERFNITKGLFLTLKKKCQDLQQQFSTYQKVKETIEACCKENVKVVEDFTQKFNFLSLQNSENIAILNNALKSEQQNNIVLKELCEQQNLNFEKEHKSLCKLIENYQEELKSFSKELEKEKKCSVRLEQENKNLSLEVSKLEAAKEEYFKKWQETESLLQTTSESKIEFEKKYDSECIKVSNLNEKCKELEECNNKQKLEFEENCSALKTTNASLESAVADLEEKAEKHKNENEKLNEVLLEGENEKSILEKKLSDVVKENGELQNQLNINAKVSDEKIGLLMKQNDETNESLMLLKEELEKIIQDKENLSKCYSEKDEKLTEITKEYESTISKLKELSDIEEKYIQTLKKVEKMEIDLQLKSDLLISKEKQIEEISELKCKSNENLIKMKELEESVHLKSEQLDLKDKKIEELKMIDKMRTDALSKVEDLEKDLYAKNELLSIKDMKIEEMNVIEEKLSEALHKIDDLENELSSKNQLLNLKDMKIEEMSVVEEKLSEALYKIDDLENELSSKNQLLSLKDLDIEEKNCFEQKYASVLEKVKELEEDVRLKEETINNQEKKVIELNSMLKEKNRNLEKLEYENFEMKDSLEKERESVKICLECEMMKETAKELDHLRNALMENEKTLLSQKQQTSKLTKMLTETEDNFDEMRIKKEKEIIKYKETIQSLQHEIKILKVEAGEAEKLRREIEGFQLDIEKQKLQQTSDQERFKSENEKLRIEIEALKTQKIISDISISSSQKNISKKQIEDTLEKCLKKPEKRKEMEADSCFDDIAIIKELAQPTSSTNKKVCADVTKKETKCEDYLSTPVVTEKKNRAWDSESSGSECLEIVFDKDAKRLTGFTPKYRSVLENKKTPLKSVMFGNLTSTPVLGSAQRTKMKIINNFTPKTLLNRKTVQGDSANEDFISNKGSAKMVTLGDSPWNKNEEEIKRTPSMSTNKKFFKTPLKERELALKKPQLKKLWF